MAPNIFFTAQVILTIPWVFSLQTLMTLSAFSISLTTLILFSKSPSGNGTSSVSVLKLSSASESLAASSMPQPLYIDLSSISLNGPPGLSAMTAVPPASLTSFDKIFYSAEIVKGLTYAFLYLCIFIIVTFI